MTIVEQNVIDDERYIKQIKVYNEVMKRVRSG